MKSPYEILGIPEGTSVDDAIKAYKKLARKYHPDSPDGNVDKFKEIGEAIDKIKNPKPEPQFSSFDYNNYDFDHNNFERFFNNIFQDQMRGRSRNRFDDVNFGQSIRQKYQYNITLEQAYHGFSFLGKGNVAGGVANGAVHVISDGNVETEYYFTYKPHPKFKVLSVNSLEMTVDVPLLTCVLGGTIEIQTICKSNLKVTIKECTSHKSKMRISGYGMNTGPNKTRGDLLININPIFPASLTEEEKDLYTKLNNIRK